MSAYASFRQIKATRKPHSCEACAKQIEVGSPAQYWAGDCDGDFYSCYWHVECRTAEVAINEEYGAWGDEYSSIRSYLDDEPTYIGWLIEKYPIVADRMGLRA